MTPTIGGMVICDSSEQAKQMFAIFQERLKPKVVPFSGGISTNPDDELPLAADSAAGHLCRAAKAGQQGQKLAP